MNYPLVTPPELDDDAVVAVHDFIYEVLDAFEAHYYYQLARHARNTRSKKLQEHWKYQTAEDPPF